MATRLSREFFAEPCLAVSQALLGMHLVHKVGQQVFAGRIVETEAYVGVEDQACHARFGPTKRARLLFGPPGHAYVYLIYGMYDCFNVVTQPTGAPSAVLIRALEPDAGVDEKTDGPGKLCRALRITRLQNDADLTRSRELWIEDRGTPAQRIVATPRIGIEYAGAWAKKPWRFVDADSRFLSRKLR
jgi:DNA-3-methyladenine glycosylase